MSDTYTFYQVAIYTAGSQSLMWREVVGGELPTGRSYLRAATFDNVIFVTGGLPSGSTEILSWDPLTESWRPVGNMKNGRYGHAAVAIPSSIIESECSAVP